MNDTNTVPVAATNKIWEEFETMMRDDVEWQKSFDLYHDAIRRGTKLWQGATGLTQVLPDTAKLVAWLLDLVYKAELVQKDKKVD